MKSAAYASMLAAAVTVAAAGPALAQAVVQGPPGVVYDQSLDPAYQEQLRRYQAQREAYNIQHDVYRQQRRDWRRDWEEYRARRDDYDALYGQGAYDRWLEENPPVNIYRPAP